jgi:hypothetical protein
MIIELSGRQPWQRPRGLVALSYRPSEVSTNSKVQNLGGREVSDAARRLIKSPAPPTQPKASSDSRPGRSPARRCRRAASAAWRSTTFRTHDRRLRRGVQPTEGRGVPCARRADRDSSLMAGRVQRLIGTRLDAVQFDRRQRHGHHASAGRNASAPGSRRMEQPDTQVALCRRDAWHV